MAVVVRADVVRAERAAVVDDLVDPERGAHGVDVVGDIAAAVAAGSCAELRPACPDRGDNIAGQVLQGRAVDGR